MPHNNHGFRNDFFTALNRCVAASFFTAEKETAQQERNFPAAEISRRAHQNLSRERYLAIPTFIRQGKTLNI